MRVGERSSEITLTVINVFYENMLTVINVFYEFKNKYSVMR